MNFQDWVGRAETTDDCITPTPCAALAALLDRDPSRPADGTVLPPLWHWLYFLPVHGQAEIGPDGHPLRGGFLPPVPLPRRMWAGSLLEFHRPLHLGDAVTRRSVIESVSEKNGRSGSLVFVKVRHEICKSGDPAPCISESQDIVYRQAAAPSEPGPSPTPACSSAAWKNAWTPDEVFLFRYSALTFNSHRIHYDRPYATQTEGYPRLVVHGPLIATLLLELVRRQRPDARVRRFEFRAVKPLFDGRPLLACGEPDAQGSRVHLWAQDNEGSLAMDASAVLE